MELSLSNILDASMSDTKAKLLSHLEAKYNETFEIVSEIGRGWGNAYDKFGVRPLNCSNGDPNDELFTVLVENDELGYHFFDSYYGVYILPAYISCVHSILDKLLQVYKLSVTIRKDVCYPNTLTKSISVNEIHEHYKDMNGNENIVMSNIKILMPNSVKESIKPIEICEALADNQLSATVQLYFEDDERLSFSGPLTEPITYHIDSDQNIVGIGTKKDLARAPGMVQELTVWQLERLCSIVYLDGIINYKDVGNLYDILTLMLATEFSQIKKEYPCEMTKDEWIQVINDILGDKNLRALKIVKSIDISVLNTLYHDALPGHRAICLLDDYGNAIVVFRGTHGDEEWLDNARGMLTSDTPQQIASVKFVCDVREDAELSIKHLTVAGHSKGGNKAQYSAITAPDFYVDRCVSVDGQGFSNEFKALYKCNIEKRKHILELISEQRDFVNCLGNYIATTNFYRGRRGNTTHKYPYGAPLPFFHCPDALRNANGEAGEHFTQASISSVINSMVIYLLSDKKFDSKRNSIIMDIILLMMKKKPTVSKLSGHTDNNDYNDRIAEAIKNLVLVFIDLFSHDDIFYNKVDSLVYEESNVIFATLELAFGVTTFEQNILTAQKQNNIAKLVLHKLALSLISISNLSNFIRALIKLINLLKKIYNDTKSDPAMAHYIISFISTLLGHMLNTTSSKSIDMMIKSIESKWRNLSDKVGASVNGQLALLETDYSTKDNDFVNTAFDELYSLLNDFSKQTV